MQKSVGSESVAVVLKRALELYKAGKVRNAEALYKQVLEQDPRHFDALHYLGIIKAQAGHNEAALELVSAAVLSNPQSAEARVHLGHIQAALGEAEAALQSYDQALALVPRYPEAWYARGNLMQELKRHEEAVASYDRALAQMPGRPEVLANRGNALHDLKRYDEALESYDRALALMPGSAMLHNNRGNTLRELKRCAEALASLDKALNIEPGYVDAVINRGNVLQDLGRWNEALACYDKVLAAYPDHLATLNNRGNVLRDLKRHEDAAACVARLLELAPEWDYAPGVMFQSHLHSCDWTRYAQHAARITQRVRDGKKTDLPFSFLAVSDSAADQLLCARIYAGDKYPPSAAPLWAGQRYRHDRIRLAYLSGDFHDHATAYLMAGLFEAHDRDRFETTAISFGPDKPDEMRARLRASFGRFIDVRNKSDREAALLLREMEIDIAVDLKGFTLDSRAGILAYRPSPIQVNYLGYPGTMAAEYVDYILADCHVVPQEHQAYYTEKIVRLPDTYQVNDAKRKISERTPTRAECGLPETGFVFCCFNNNYKITPTLFDVWMRLLQRIEGSALWLLEGSATAARNLRGEAERRGVAPQRLIFGPHVKVDEHLARHRLADLFLDTLPYNAHTTASDALWAGLPVLACTGNAFAGRVSTSLLSAVGLPELITRNLAEYEALALRLATTPAMLAGIASKLAHNRSTYPLFNTDRFRRNMEAAYVMMWERYQRGEPVASFEVEPVI